MVRRPPRTHHGTRRIGHARCARKKGATMYYSSGNYEAFARPKKPAGIEHKSAYIVGTGLAALSAACYLVRDAQMPGKNIHIFEKDDVAGGACDGLDIPGLGYVMRGGREMDNHFEVMWDLFRSIPSIETPGVSVLDEYYWLNKEDPNYSLCRATKNRGQDAGCAGKFGLSDKAAMEIMELFFTPDEKLYDRPITDFFDDEVLASNFWMYWRTMFAFENWHSALEMKLYIKRYIHHIAGLPDFSALRFTRYNQYESMILPLIEYLKAAGVQFHFNTKVEDIRFSIGGGAGPVRPRTGTGQDTIQRIQQAALPRNPHSSPEKKVATSIMLSRTAAVDGAEAGATTVIDLTEDDLVFITNGGCVENSTMGAQDRPAAWRPELSPGGGWDMWRRIAAQDPSFGHPDTFCGDPEKTKWMSATVTTLDGEIPPYIQAICKRDPFSGHVVTGGIVTCTDSNWLMSWTLNRQQQFRDQPKNELCVWVYGLFPDEPGNYVRKPMRDCTGEEICQEWLYHMGVPEDRIAELAARHANTVPVMMPYITAFFMPRAAGDRPDVVPDGAVNFAFIGQFAETPRDTIFTTEYSMRTGMEAVYTLCDVDRGVPEVWGSVFDVRDLLMASVKLRDGKPVTDMKLGLVERFALKEALKKVRGTDIEKVLREFEAI